MLFMRLNTTFFYKNHYPFLRNLLILWSYREFLRGMRWFRKMDGFPGWWKKAAMRREVSGHVVAQIVKPALFKFQNWLSSLLYITDFLKNYNSKAFKVYYLKFHSYYISQLIMCLIQKIISFFLNIQVKFDTLGSLFLNSKF